MSINMENAKKWLSNYNFKTYASSLFSFAVDIAFIFYNLYTGFKYDSLWHKSVSLYYIILFLIRGTIILTKRFSKRTNYSKNQNRAMVITSILMFLLNLSLAGPVIAMLHGYRYFTLSLIPVIGIAAYTFYKNIMAIIHVIKARKTEDPLVLRLRAATLMDALFSILVLQNSMIMVIDGAVEGNMLKLSVATTLIISALIIGISILILIDTGKIFRKK
ncbi:MAG: hypothetical protein K5634_04910 [Sphaerochaetaceae bacterium]|nr:hypothetical protein [Sphaerochaetaceae bacterium]